MRTVVRLFSSVVWSLPKAEVEALFSSKRHGRVAGASLRVAGALWWQFIASRALGGSRRVLVRECRSHNSASHLAATGALILTKHSLHPKSDPKSEGGGTWAVGRRRSRRGEGGSMAPLGGAHERAAHDDSFAARRDVRELLFDMSFVDGVITLENALALGGTTLHDR